MYSSEYAMPAAVQARLWREAAGGFAYAVLDGAQNPQLLDMLFGANAPAFECLFTGELEPDMACVAPYLVQLESGSAFTDWLLNYGWGLNWGIYLASEKPLRAIWLHLRQFIKIYDPEGVAMYFRFYDPRVLRSALGVLDESQLMQLLQHARLFLAEAGQPQAAAHAWCFVENRLLQDQIA